MIRQWFKTGAPWVWLNAAAVSLSLIMVFGLLILIAIRGLGHFWPAPVAAFEYVEKGSDQASTVIGEIVESQVLKPELAKAAGYTPEQAAAGLTQYLIKTGNRDISGLDFRWLLGKDIKQTDYPKLLMVLERREWGNFYGYLESIKQDGKIVAEGVDAWTALTARMERTLEIFEQIKEIEKHDIGAINYQLERLRLKQRKFELEDTLDAQAKQSIAVQTAAFEKKYQALQSHLAELNQQIKRDTLVAKAANGQEVEIALAKVVLYYRPNAMNVLQKTGHYFSKVWEFLSDDPREANTEGGVFPAIFGTVMMVMIMAVIVTPFGVVAAVYMREYAKQGVMTRIIRIAVNNLAGVPSIVYGVFGLGFFVYILGGNIDALFFPEALPAPTYGTPGMLWASLTLALLTLPVVIVSTEEGLSRIPKSIREGSLALGATKAETLWRTVLPMASPAMMTGLILAVARAAGEVAPLMLVGVVKLAPTLPLDGNFPFIHLDRKFMHLGFHIYDVGFQSPNVEAARPLVYATALLLVLVIIGLNLFAVGIRNHLREKYRALEN
ncbi:phosphate ABC transporter permease [Methyloprofundus sedimenti]|uniref:Phosphate transport system permease protein PstA n=1 Tax=Methyloprofundus sedimenti TaxID=1420851 RepID=A0A1V8M5K3_9GAMM|nr:phosphate ABC transporter permease PstA [Methyloprofundus sedimenti]OQK16841.1 phosphate ABC transporter permease [Methyloprofundus sedimenti]